MECSDEMKANMEWLGARVWATILAREMARNDTTNIALKTSAEWAAPDKNVYITISIG